jgi:DNA-binding response OmpR family regulator
MNADDARKVVLLSRQLTERLMSAALCAKELDAIASAAAEARYGGLVARHNRNRKLPKANCRPLMDESTLSVLWNGRSVHLGHTQGYWLLTRLLRCVNQYVTHLDLLREVWDDEFADASVLRAGVRRLRMKLRRGGMAALARGIVGHHGRYMFDLTAATRHPNVTAASRRTSQP